MGIKLFGRSSASYSGWQSSDTGNPNPDRWSVVRWVALGQHLLVELNYPDCKNYEGRKILLYKNWTIEELKKQGKVDPHFSDEKKWRSPFARFEPTPEGWLAGILLGNALS